MVAQSFREEAFHHLLAMIDRGEIKIGDKVPGQRELAEILRMSRGATSQALMDLKRMGVTAARGRAGTFLVKLPENVIATEADALMTEYLKHDEEIMDHRRAQHSILRRLSEIAKGVEE